MGVSSRRECFFLHRLPIPINLARVYFSVSVRRGPLWSISGEKRKEKKKRESARTLISHAASALILFPVCLCALLSSWNDLGSATNGDVPATFKFAFGSLILMGTGITNVQPNAFGANYGLISVDLRCE